ncbi:NAD(+) kinase [soil metagenome]
MPKKFKHIGIIARLRATNGKETLLNLISFLQAERIGFVIEQETADYLAHPHLPTCAREELGKHCDLIIVVGGDGSLLYAAKTVVDQQIPVLGINRGRLGFLADIKPSELTTRLGPILNGHYHEEQRFLLDAVIRNGTHILYHEIALNEVILIPGAIAHMIEFEVYINQKFVFSQRADGQIIATPTGSTAYALSGGGPILQPGLDAIVLVPMFPHTLSSRPIVVDGSSNIEIVIAKDNVTAPHLSCDGQERVPVPLGYQIHIRKKTETLKLIHPLDYDYYETLRTKLRWGAKL